MLSDCLYRQAGMPLFQNVTYATQDEAATAPIGNVELVQDLSSGLVFNRCFDPDVLQYDGTYQNEQACSEVFKQHLASVLFLVKRHFRFGDSVVEIGCGKGYFLEMMQALGMEPLGFDPSYEGTNQRVEKRYFGAHDTPRCDLLILRHVLEHIPQPFQFLSTLSATARPETKIYIEVPCFEWIIAHRAFYDIFYEHCNYFTLDALINAFARVHEAGRFFGHQYLYLIADLASFRVPSGYCGTFFSTLSLDREIEAWHSNASAGLPPLVWGAGAKGITFTQLLYRRGIAVAGLVDINPAKQGRYVALSASPIYAQELAAPLVAAGHQLYVMNPNYLQEILRMFPERTPAYRCVT